MLGRPAPPCKPFMDYGAFVFMDQIVTILLTHQNAEAVGRMVAYWTNRGGASSVLVAYGGEAGEYGRIAHPAKCLVEDPELRTTDHPRERQSYLGVLRATVPLLAEMGATHVHLAEYDEVPLVDGLEARLLQRLRAEDADVLGHNLRRVDSSSHPHWLNHTRDPWFARYWESMSCRDDRGVILSMLGCGSFWSFETYRQVADLKPTGRIYLELFLPTAAHHLGFRVRGTREQEQFMQPHQEKTPEMLDGMRQAGAWVAHPVKGFWTA